jgi:hypothetical protein
MPFRRAEVSSRQLHGKRRDSFISPASLAAFPTLATGGLPELPEPPGAARVPTVLFKFKVKKKSRLCH